MSDFPSTVPVSTDEVRVYLRFWLGDVDEETISDDNMNTLINLAIMEHGDQNPCLVTYYSAINVLNWLIRKGAASTSSGSSGLLTKRREKEGNYEIEETYSDSATTSAASWDDVLAGLLDSPSTIGCDVDLGGNTSTSTGSVIIGSGNMTGAQGAFNSRNKIGQAYVANRMRGGRSLF